MESAGESRRSFLRTASGAVGVATVAAVVAHESDLTQASGPNEAVAERGRYSLEEVTASAPARGKIAFRNAEIDAVATGFPDGWEFAEGDLVVVDRDSQIAWPYVTSDGHRWYAVNRDARGRRLIAHRP